jgi:hypothetical protein
VLDDLFVADNLRAAQDAAMRPPPVPKQAATFSAWRTTTAAPRGVVAGGAEAGGFLADVVGAFGNMAAASGLGDPTLADRGQVQREADRIQREGLQFDTGAGFRGFAAELAPDPETAHTAEQLVFGATRLLSKAAGYSIATGNPFSGAALTGGDEAMATAEQLRLQGVDLATRTQAGAVVGLTTALGVALPVAGTTARQTAGLVLAGGPGAFMAQQQAVRSILEAANYDSLAEQYDPLDPVGLAVSTLVPAAFGAWGLRSARARAARQAEQAKAQAEAEFAAGPLPSEPTQVAAAVREATVEQVDAARVMLSRQMRESSNPARADDPQAMQAHETALAKAEDQMARGEPVAVLDVVPQQFQEPAPPIQRVTVDIIKRRGVDAIDVEKTLAKLPPVADGFVRLYRGESPTTKFSDVFDVSQLTSERAPQIPGARYTPDIKYADYYRSSYGRDATLHYIDVPEQVAQAGRVSDYEVKVDLDAVNAARAGPITAYAQRIAEASRLIDAEAPKTMEATLDAPTPRGTDAPPPPATQPPRADAPGAQGAGPAAAEPAPARTGDTAAPAGLVDEAAGARVAQLELEQPGLMVMLDGMESPRPLSEVMATVKAEADELRLDGDLMELAAQCALSVGN